MEMLNQIQVQGLTPVKDFQFVTATLNSIGAHIFSKIYLLKA